MRYWWVNQNQTFAHETAGGYLWSTKRSKNGARNPIARTVEERTGSVNPCECRPREPIGRATRSDSRSRSDFSGVSPSSLTTDLGIVVAMGDAAEADAPAERRASMQAHARLRTPSVKRMAEEA